MSAIFRTFDAGKELRGPAPRHGRSRGRNRLAFVASCKPVSRMLRSLGFLVSLAALLPSPLAAAPVTTVSGGAAQQPGVVITGGESRANHRVDDLELELIWVKPGTFKMGTAHDDPDRHKSDGPLRRVTLTRGFWLGKTEVTQAQYEAVTGTNPSALKSAGPRAPVERVSWIDAMAFCRKLTERERAAGRLPEGFAFTLPTEAQWEYACRAGTTGAYPGEPDAMSWHAANSGDTTHPVATKQPNAWGFHDMAGNVLEWCLDWYEPAYPPGPATDPAGPRRGYYRTARGGSWRTPVEIGRSAVRAGGSAGRQDYTLGFRVALCAEKT